MIEDPLGIISLYECVFLRRCDSTWYGSEPEQYLSYLSRVSCIGQTMPECKMQLSWTQRFWHAA